MASSTQSCENSLGNSPDETIAECLTASFTPREYQIELLDAAKDHNTIACLGTGTGKTFIAVMLIRELAAEVRVLFDEGGKRIIFLVPTVPLVNQQKQVLEEHTDLKIAGYYGEMQADTWDLARWHEEFKQHEVLVMTAEICRIILHHAFLKVSQIKLLIFDECHRAQGCHPYREIMRCFEQCPAEDMPRVFGLSASLLNQKINPSSLEKKICELEKTLRSTVETASDLTDVQKYGTDPKQYLVLYNVHVIQNFAAESEYLRKSLELIGNGGYCTEENSEIQFFSAPKNCVKQVLDALDNLSVWCAYHVAKLYLKEIKCLLKNLQNKNNNDILTSVQSVLENFKLMCDCNFSSLIHSQKTIDLSPKLRRLLEVFVEIKNGQWFFGEENKKLESSQRGLPSNYSSETNTVQSAPICGIVFVEQRITAYILCHWLIDVVKNNPDFEFLVPGFVVGHGINQKLGANETSMSFKKQTQVISDFREKKLNMLFATSVIEEGVDVPKCNVVIRFDLPKDFRSYVQSKGRARAQNSIYVMLASSVELSFVKESLNNYLLIEKLLIERCHNRVMPSEEEIHEHIDDSLLPPYMPVKKDGAPRITLTSAIGLVNRYCAKLPCDKATRLFPRWKIIPLVDALTKCVQYVCHMNLPINSSVRETIVGEKMSRKRTAKMAAALKACELLHQAGELDDNFICHSVLLDNILNELIGSLDLEETSNNGLHPGTKQYRRVYNKGIADAFKDTLPLHGVSCYLYVLEMELTEPLPEKLNRRRRPIVDPSNTSLGFGILSKKQIPKVCAFPIFTRSGKVVVSIKYVNSCLHCEEEMGKLSEFHRFLFSRSLFLENTVEYCPSKAIFSIYIVPVNKDEGSTYHIDWDFIDYTKKHQFNSEICKPKNEITRLKFKKDLFMDCVVTRSYMIDSLNEKAPIFHFVNQIEYGLSPCSCLTKQYGSYKNYYKMKYDLDIQFDNQPLLDTERINSITLWKPIYVSRKQIVDTNTLKISKSKQKSMNFREHLIPELCIIHPFPATLFRKAINIPTILFRLNALLRAEQLRKSVTTSMSLGEPDLQDELNWPVFDFEKSNDDLKNALNCHVQYQKNASSQDITKSFQNGVNDIISFEVHHDNFLVGPNPGIILQALTPKSAGDEFNLERLETIGDSFLKYSMSVKIYTSYSGFDEGKLTKLRSGIVRNLNLYKLGKNKLLPEFLVCEPFNGKSNWLPPCYILDSDIEMKLAQKRCNKKHKAEDIDFMYLFTKQVISDKCVADSVEALIGAYLLHCGHLGALNFMYWMGLNAFPTVSEEDNAQKSNCRVWPLIPRSPMFENASSAFDKLCMLTSGMERFENIINYHFKNKAYLLQAFTHPSYTYNDITDCFQRLEFLGDAVLDFLITRKLYDDPKQHSPGDLTDLRAALVNNTYFAALAIKYEYNKFIKMLSPKLFILIEAYIELMKRSQAFQTFELYGYFLEEVECFDIEEIEVPKVLGDVFESVAGAIYLDSGMSLDAVWKIYYPLMKPAIDHMSECVPKVPVRMLLEMLPFEKPFGNPVVSGDKVTVQVKLPSGTVVCGVGPNKNVAKRSAAKRAISVLKRENLPKF